MIHSIHRPAACCLLAAIAFISGCSGDTGAKKLSLKGKLLDGANPYILDATKLKLPAGTSLPPGARPLQVTFIPVEKGETVPANVDAATGTFTVTLPAGKYKIAVTASAGPGTADLFNGRFSTDKSQIVRDLSEGTEIVIDITKPTG